MPGSYHPLALKHYSATFKPQPAPKLKTPKDAPTGCFEFSTALVPYLLGLLEEYRWSDKLVGTDAEIAQALSVFEDLRYILMNPQDCAGIGQTCVDYQASHSMFTYSPQDPFTQPGYIPPGYIASPFDEVTSTVIAALTGLQLGDVITGYLSLPIHTPALGQGIARIHAEFKGKGTAEIHLLAIPKGGTALVVPDREVNPLTWLWVTLDRDPFAVPASSVTAVITEIEFLTDKPHTIDIYFLPRFSSGVGLVGYGGGFRKLNLCGFEATNKGGGNPSDCAWESEDDGMRLRINPANPCEWQQDCGDGVWGHFWSPDDCGKGTVTQPSGQGEMSPGQCKIFNVVLQGKEKWISPVPVGPGYSVEVSGSSGAWYPAVGPLWYCPNGGRFGLGNCSNVFDTDSGNPMPAKPRARLIFDHNGTFYDGYNTLTTIPINAPLSDLIFQMNDVNLTDNAGNVSFNVRICAPASGEFTPEDLVVNATTATPVTMTQATSPTKVYKITLSGTAIVGVDSGTPLNGDAFYRQGSAGGAYNTQDVQVWINGAAFPAIPSVETTHIYEINKQGDGTQWSFFLHDAQYSDNSGSLAVRVEQL